MGTIMQYSQSFSGKPIDSELSEASANPVQNKIVTEALNNKVTGKGLEFSVIDGILNVTYDDGGEE